MAKTTYTHKSGAEAAHETQGKHHVVGIGNLRVFILPDGPFWFAQGLEIDYGAQGDSIEDAKKNFEDGLEATIDLHLKIYGNIESILEPAPSGVLIEAARDLELLELYTQVSRHSAKVRQMPSFPFSGIDYFARKSKVA